MLSRLLVIIFCFCVTPTFGQTLSEINLKYGDPTYSYSVTQHIWMTPDFAGDGQVCRMRLYPKHIGSQTDYPAPQLYFEELNGALIKLVPLESRGLKREAFGLTDFGGGAAWTTYAYEKVTFVFTFRFRTDPGFNASRNRSPNRSNYRSRSCWRACRKTPHLQLMTSPLVGPLTQRLLRFSGAKESVLVNGYLSSLQIGQDCRLHNQWCSNGTQNVAGCWT